MLGGRVGGCECFFVLSSPSLSSPSPHSPLGALLRELAHHLQRLDVGLGCGVGVVGAKRGLEVRGLVNTKRKSGGSGSGGGARVSSFILSPTTPPLQAHGMHSAHRNVREAGYGGGAGSAFSGGGCVEKENGDETPVSLSRPPRPPPAAPPFHVQATHGVDTSLRGGWRRLGFPLSSLACLCPRPRGRSAGRRARGRRTGRRPRWGGWCALSEERGRGCTGLGAGEEKRKCFSFAPHFVFWSTRWKLFLPTHPPQRTRTHTHHG